jgi:Zn-dependent metalloprotease
LTLTSSVHFGQTYADAFWDGSQMVFGDGNTIFANPTKCLEIVGHELTHGVIQWTAGLLYAGQSGALNESIADVFGSLAK